jgi:hypothetical protein
MTGYAVRYAVASALLALAGMHAGAAPRTFVASSGSDADNCSLATPCRSFGTAIAQTDAGGEILVLDSAGYGRVTITKSVAIIAPPGVHAGISVAAGSTGVLIFNATAVVVLRGLVITGQPGSASGIYLNQAARLHVEHCTISNMGADGVRLRAGHAYIADSTIRNNGANGIHARESIRVVVDRTRIEHNGDSGMLAGNGTVATVTNSVLAGNVNSGMVIDSDDANSMTAASVTDTSLSHNGSLGLWARAENAGSVVQLALTRSTVSSNSLGGVQMRSDTGVVYAALTDNTIAHNVMQAGGVWAQGAGLRAMIDRNTIWTNEPNGVVQLSGALIRSRENNTIRYNDNDIFGVLTPSAGD